MLKKLKAGDVITSITAAAWNAIVDALQQAHGERGCTVSLTDGGLVVRLGDSQVSWRTITTCTPVPLADGKIGLQFGSIRVLGELADNSSGPLVAIGAGEGGEGGDTLIETVWKDGQCVGVKVRETGWIDLDVESMSLDEDEMFIPIVRQEIDEWSNKLTGIHIGEDKIEVVEVDDGGGGGDPL